MGIALFCDQAHAADDERRKSGIPMHLDADGGSRGNESPTQPYGDDDCGQPSFSIGGFLSPCQSLLTAAITCRTLRG